MNNKVNSTENTSSNYTTDVILQSKKTAEEKREEIRIDFTKRASEAEQKVELQRKVYKEAMHQEAEIKHTNWILGRKANSDYYKNNQDIQDKYELSNTDLATARSNRDSELWRLQVYTDNFVKASRMTWTI